MNDNVENLILTQLREIRGELGDIRSEMSDFRKETEEGFEDVTQRVNGVSVILTMLAGHVQSIEDRVETLEEAKKE